MGLKCPSYREAVMAADEKKAKVKQRKASQNSATGVLNELMTARFYWLVLEDTFRINGMPFSRALNRFALTRMVCKADRCLNRQWIDFHRDTMRTNARDTFAAFLEAKEDFKRTSYAKRCFGFHLRADDPLEDELDAPPVGSELLAATPIHLLDTVATPRTAFLVLSFIKAANFPRRDEPQCEAAMRMLKASDDPLLMESDVVTGARTCRAGGFACRRVVVHTDDEDKGDVPRKKAK